MGLERQRRWLRRAPGRAGSPAPRVPADIVTYHHDPRRDPDQLARPAAVVAGGVRLRSTLHAPQMVPPVRLTISPRVMPYGVWKAATGRHRPDRAEPAGPHRRPPGIRSCAASKRNAPGSVASSPPSSLLLPAAAGSCLPGISWYQDRCAPSADRCPSPPRGHAQAARQAAPADTPLPLARVMIVQDMRRPCLPADTRPATDLDPYPRVGLDIPDPVGAPPALGHQPEGLPPPGRRTLAYAAAVPYAVRSSPARRRPQAGCPVAIRASRSG
jgi:hypothetical protein